MDRQASRFRLSKTVWLLVGGVALACTHLMTGSRPTPTTRASLDIVGEDSVPGLGRGYTRWRRAVAGCKDRRVQVYIEAYPETKNANPDVPFDGEIRAAHIINLGRCETEMYRLLPFGQAEYQLVMYWDRATPRQQVLELRQIARSPGVIASRRPGKAKGCGHTQAQASVADFWKCENGEHPSASKLAMRMGMLELGWVNALVRRTLQSATALTSAEDPAWFSCTSGCCVPMSVY